jgi:hypothetical protein
MKHASELGKLITVDRDDLSVAFEKLPIAVVVECEPGIFRENERVI